MSKYLFIESRDPYESNAVRGHVELAVDLRRRGHTVALFLVQNGVLPARPGASCEEIREAITADIEVLADEFSMRERGIVETGAGVRTARIEVVIDRLAAGWKTVFC